jgi:predicted nuclease of predicted toxin-antitoxin system
VFEVCRQQSRVLVTADKKLTKFLAAAHALSPSVLILRAHDGDHGVVVRELIAGIEAIERTVSARGPAVFSIRPGGPMRVELLPLGAVEPPD